jgi:hypothetical protein
MRCLSTVMLIALALAPVMAGAQGGGPVGFLRHRFLGPDPSEHDGPQADRDHPRARLRRVGCLTRPREGWMEGSGNSACALRCDSESGRLEDHGTLGQAPERPDCD